MIIDYFISLNKKKSSNNYEFWSRSFIKSLSWRLLGTIDTIIISYFIIGDLSSALSMVAFVRSFIAARKKRID